MLYERILNLKQETSQITVNPVLDAFNLNECKRLDRNYLIDPFVKSKIKKCLNYLKGLKIDFDVNYISAYNEYCEAITYIQLKRKYNTERVSETTTSTPDFHVSNTIGECFDLYVEVKSLSFLDGNLNFKEAQKSGLNANIHIEDQIKSGRKIAFGETSISPFSKKGRIPTIRELIEIYIEKINQNIKRDQYCIGDTVLFVDIEQLLLGSSLSESGLPIYQEKLLKSMVSGVLWHTAFGLSGNMIFSPIEFEGKPNLDSPLTQNGILVEHEYIKGLVFASYSNLNKRNFLGFYRYKDQDQQPSIFIKSFCNLYNDDNNCEAWWIMKKRV
jgi:hypothetical protein